MKVLLLSDVNSAHTIKWVNGLKSDKIELALFSFSDSLPENKSFLSDITFLSASVNQNIIKGPSQLKKFTHYLKTLPKLKRLIKNFKPDIIHAHYISSYGFIASLTGFKKIVLTAWGTEIFVNPNLNFINKLQISKTLKSASVITSASEYMASEIRKYTDRKVIVVPFGIDTSYFKPSAKAANNEIVIGTIKALQSNYGIETLINAFSICVKKFPGKKLKLLIVGEGDLKNDLINTTVKLGIKGVVTFTGKIPYTEVYNYHNQIDIFVAPSLRESFGVSLLEAMSCGKAVIASGIPAFKEIIKNNNAGILFKAGDENDLADKLSYLINNPDEIKQLGKQARILVEKEYNWNICVNKMIQLYQSLM